MKIALASFTDLVDFFGLLLKKGSPIKFIVSPIKLCYFSDKFVLFLR